MKLDNWISEKINLNSELSRVDLESYQLNTLNNLIKYVKEKSPFYKNLYEDINSINSLEELYKIPVIDKGDIIQNGNKMVCVNQSEISRIVSLDTSGTMGPYKRIYFTEEDQNLTIDFFTKGLSFLVDRGDIMMIMLPFQRENSVGDLIKQALEIMEVKPVLNGNLKLFKETANLMINNNVNSIVGMPVEILSLGRYIRRENLPIRIKSILLSADTVNDTLINEIRDVYECEVFNHFGMTETGLGAAVECNFHQGMHIRENDLLIEIVNPITKEPVEEGKCGEVIVTTLTRNAMPLIRYATGDISSLISEKCSCNSILKRLDKIKYRMDDRAHIGKNLYININQTDSILFQLKNLINYKIKVEKFDECYVLHIQLAFFNDKSIETEELKIKIKNLLLTNPRIKKSHEMEILKFNIKIIYSDENISFYNRKRRITSD